MTDIIFWAIIGLMIGWHTPAPFWATWFWNMVWGWFGKAPPTR